MYSKKCHGTRNDAMAMQGHLFRVYFASGKSMIDAKGQKAISDAVTAYSKGGHEVLIAGHADTVGSSARNLELSKARAAAVRTMLIDNGLAATNINENYFGENQPLVNTRNQVSNARNRSVLIVVR